MMNIRDSDARGVTVHLEELESRLESLLEKVTQAATGDGDRLELKHLYQIVKQEMKGEAQHYGRATFRRKLSDVQRDFLVPALQSATNALLSPASSPPANWLSGIQLALSHIRTGLSDLETSFPESPVVSIHRLQREILEFCRTKTKSQSKLIRSLKRFGCREDAERCGGIFTSFYNVNGLPVAVDVEKRQVDLIREGDALKALLASLGDKFA